MPRIVRLLGARALTPYLLLAYCVFVFVLALFGTTVAPQAIERMSRMAPLPLLDILIGIHLACGCILLWPTVRQRISLAAPAMDAALPLPGLGAQQLAATARTARLKLRWLAAGRQAVLYRNRWSPAGTLLFHAALLLLPVAFGVSRATRFRGDAWIIEGRPFGGTRAEYARVEPPDRFDERAPDVRFMVERVAAAFWGDRLFFTELGADVALEAGGGARSMSLTAPLALDGARVSIHGFNYTPSFELVGPGGAVVDSGDLNLRLFPPGTEDSFAVPGLPHRFAVRLQAAARGYDLRQPRLHLAVTRGKRLVAQGWLAPGEPMAFDGYRLWFPAIHRGGEIMVHRDRGYPILWLALVSALLGTLGRIGFPAIRIWVAFEGGAARVVTRPNAFDGGRTDAILASWSALGI